MNKTVSYEATSVFHAWNRIVFKSGFTHKNSITEYMKEIGTQNASLIRHAVLHVPCVLPIFGDDDIFKKSLAVFEMFQEQCPNLTSIITVKHRFLKPRDDLVDPAVKLLNRHVRRIPSLQSSLSKFPGKID